MRASKARSICSSAASAFGAAFRAASGSRWARSSSGPRAVYPFGREIARLYVDRFHGGGRGAHLFKERQDGGFRFQRVMPAARLGGSVDVLFYGVFASAFRRYAPYARRSERVPRNLFDGANRLAKPLGKRFRP